MALGLLVMVVMSLLGLEAPAAMPPDPAESSACREDATTPIEYLMLAPADAAADLQPLVAAHRARGLTVAVCPLPPVATPHDVSAAIEAVHRRGQLRYVLLVGDDWQGNDFRLPALRRDKVAYTDSPDSPDYPTDLPYAPPDVAIGRFPVQDHASLQRVVAKTVAHLKAPGGDWQRRLALFGGPANFSPFVDGLIEGEVQRLLGDSVPYLYDLRFVFAKTDSPYTWRPDRLSQKITDELAPGALFTAYFGHGLPTALDLVWYRDTPYNIGDAESLARLHIDSGKPIAFLLACYTGAFDDQDGTPSLAEALFLNPDGPVAVIASSRTSHPYGNAVYARALVDVFLTQRAPTLGVGLRRVRDSLGQHRLKLAEFLVKPAIGPLLEEHAGLYVLLGDPALPIRYPAELPLSVREGDRPAPLVAPGQALTVRLPTGGAHDVITLETDRRTIRGELAPTDAEDLQAAFDAMTANYDKAIDKVVARLPAEPNGTVTLKAPERPGHYVVKALRPPDGHGDAAAGFAAFEVVAPNLGTPPSR